MDDPIQKIQGTYKTKTRRNYCGPTHHHHHRPPHRHNPQHRNHWHQWHNCYQCPSHFTKLLFWISFTISTALNIILIPSFRIIIVDHFSEDLLDACVLLGPQLIVGQFLPETTFALLAGQWLYLHGLSLSAPRLSIYQTLVKFRGLLGPNFLGALRALTENLWSCWGRTRLFW